eukprot:57552-Chlamydomonas_euryale.AAC.1
MQLCGATDADNGAVNAAATDGSADAGGRAAANAIGPDQRAGAVCGAQQLAHEAVARRQQRRAHLQLRCQCWQKLPQTRSHGARRRQHRRELADESAQPAERCHVAGAARERQQGWRRAGSALRLGGCARVAARPIVVVAVARARLHVCVRRPQQTRAGGGAGGCCGNLGSHTAGRCVQHAKQRGGGRGKGRLRVALPSSPRTVDAAAATWQHERQVQVPHSFQQRLQKLAQQAIARRGACAPAAGAPSAAGAIPGGNRGSAAAAPSAPAILPAAVLRFPAQQRAPHRQVRRNQRSSGVRLRLKQRCRNGRQRARTELGDYRQRRRRLQRACVAPQHRRQQRAAQRLRKGRMERGGHARLSRGRIKSIARTSHASRRCAYAEG